VVPLRRNEGGVGSGRYCAEFRQRASSAVAVIFSLVFVMWAIYTFVVIYHWFRYRHKSWFAVPIIVVHLFISGSIILFMISGLK
jgi:tellurite resistance protein TehA-like permease